jgi:prepilin-type processing-associated H-X9-DG protein
MKKRAFTVVELLVAIGVVAALAALLLPTVGGAVENGRQSRCVSNQRQIYSAMLAEANDNDGLVVPNLTGSVTWVHVLTSYLDIKSSLLEPPGRRPPGVFACPTSRNVMTGGGKTDYPKNSAVSENVAKAIRLSAITKPSAVVFLADGGSNGSCGRDLSPYSGTNFGLNARHRNRCNVIYYDGHGESHELDENFIKSWNKLPWSPLAQD